ncbi:MAG: hypothetical protein O2807_10710 [bacterium]|nr:hypothetical protein [bacterium]
MTRTPRKKEVFTTRLSEKTANLLRAHCENESVSASAMISTLVEEALLSEERQRRLPPLSTPLTGQERQNMRMLGEQILMAGRDRGLDSELIEKLKNALNKF